MRYVVIFIVSLLLVFSVFLMLFSLSLLLDLPTFKDMFANLNAMLIQTFLAPLGRTISHAQQTPIVFFIFALVMTLLLVIIEYRVLMGGNSDLQQMLPELRADYLFRRGQYRQALRLFKSLGQWERVAEIHRNRHQFRQAIKALEKAGDPTLEERAQLFDQMGDHENARTTSLAAARYFASRSDWEKAAALFFKGGDKAAALDSLERQFKDLQRLAPKEQLRDKCRRIIQLAESSSDFLKAAHYAEINQDIPAAVHYYSRAGNYLRAAQLSAERGESDKAAQFLQKIGVDSSQYADSILSRAKLLFDDGNFGEALKLYVEHFKRVKPSDEGIEDFYRMGLCLEKIGRLKQAREVFTRINKIRPYYMNVDERIEAIDRKGKEAEYLDSLLDKDLQSKEWGAAGGEFPPNIGERYGDLEELARGGAGIVYRAQDRLLDRVVALKQLPEQLTRDQVRMRSFFKEAKAIAKLNHPNIVAVYDILKVENIYYIVMEYINGVTVEKLLEAKNALSIRLSLFIARYVLSALSFAHRRNVVHQDIKPANIMLTEDRTVKLTDFGIARLQDELPDHSTDTVVGTPKYISPEQLQGIPADERSDVYSFGVTLYEMVTGCLPFPADGILHHHLVSLPTPPRTYNTEISPVLEAILLKCLMKNRDDRFQSARELLREIKTISRQFEEERRGET